MTPQPNYFALHGFTAGPAQWRELVPEAICPALSGHGPEPHMQAQYFEQEVARLALEAESLPEPRTLLGYSMGARVGLGILVRRPDLFTDAVLVGGNPGLTDPRARAERLAWEQNWQRLLEEHGLQAFADAWQNLPLFASQRGLAPERLAEQRKARLAHTARGLHHALGTLGLGAMPSLWEELPEVRARVVLVVGERDEKFRGLALEQAARMRQATLEVLPGAGHNPLLETPGLCARLLS